MIAIDSLNSIRLVVPNPEDRFFLFFFSIAAPKW